MNAVFTKKPLGLALGAAFAIGSAGLSTTAAASPFQLTELASGYQVAASGGTILIAEGKCGEGKCGGEKKAEESATDAEKKAEEGKCGEGKCGGEKKAHEGKCGEGKCGGDKKAQ